MGMDSSYNYQKLKVTQSKMGKFIYINYLFKIALLKKEIERVDDSYKCNHCNKLFNKEDNAKNHWNTYHICRRCTKVFPKNTVQEHIKEVHRGWNANLGFDVLNNELGQKITLSQFLEENKMI